MKDYDPNRLDPMPGQPADPPADEGGTDAGNGESVQGGDRSYGIGGDEQRDIDCRFTYHAPKADQQKRYIDIRDTAKRFAEQITRSCPPSRERSLAITNLEQAVMWANASIARNE
jgi:hypothetical protein